MLPRSDDPRRALPAEAQLDDHPMIAIWEMTQACDLVCAHCRACATTTRDPRELSTDEGRRLLDDLAAMGTPVVVLTGGDPATRPDLVELVRHGARIGLAMAVTPSGTPRMTRDMIARMADAGLSRLAVSVDGRTAELHDAFRGVTGSFAESIRILEQARAIGLETQVNTYLHPGNLRSLGAMAALVEAVGASLWSVFVLVPTGRATTSLLLTPQRLESALGELADLAQTAKFAVKTTAAPHYRRVILQRKQGAAPGVLRDLDADGLVRGQRGITDGIGFLFVSHRGDVYPSGFLPLSAGNVRTGSVADIYRKSPLFTRLRDLHALGGKCGACAFKRVCSGSRARAYAMRGDPLAEDPLCAYIPRGYVRTAGAG